MLILIQFYFRTEIDRVNKIKKAIEEAKASMPYSREKFEHMEEVLRDREDILQELEKEVKLAVDDDDTDAFGLFYRM